MNKSINHNKIRNIICYVMLVSGIYMSAQVLDPFSPRYNETINGDVTMIANNMLSRTATTNYNGTDGNHDFTNNVYVDIDGLFDQNNDNVDDTFNSSSANFSNPQSGLECLSIVKAYLYWVASDREPTNDPNSENQPNWNFNHVKLMLPGQTTYSNLTADQVIYRGRNESPHINNDPYVCVKDITSQIISLSNPFGKYQVANVEAKTGSVIGHDGQTIGTSGGWQIVFIYESPKLSTRNITLFDGYAHVTQTTNNFDINFNGFKTVPNGKIKANVILGSLEGDQDLSGDQLQIRNTSNVFVPITSHDRTSNNFFNSTITVGNTNFTDRFPASLNTLGFDAAVFELPNQANSIIDNNQTSATLRLTSNQETYGLYLLGLSVDVWSPDLDPIEIIMDSGSNPANAGDLLGFSFEVRNKGNDDAVNLSIATTLPPQITNVIPNGLPTGVTYTFNSTTGELVYYIADNLVGSNNPPFFIYFDLEVADECYFLEENCDLSFDLQFTASYNGTENPDLHTSISSSSLNDCNIGNKLPLTININQPIVDWATPANDLNRIVECSDTAALNAAQNLAPVTDKCNFTITKTSNAFVADSSCPANGTYTNSWSFTDECGETKEFFQTITVQDTTPPVLTVPADVTIECNEDESSANTGEATATDTCSSVIITQSDVVTPGSCGDTKTIVRTWTATDACNNVSTGNQTITVIDTTPPTLTLPEDITIECTEDFTSANTGLAKAEDDCGGVTISESDVVTDTCGNTMTILRTWTSTDNCGNSSSGTQTITVQDTTPPTINIPSDVTIECNEDESSANTGIATGSDTCGSVTISQSDAVTSNCGNTKTIIRTWTATDDCGNSISENQTITVQDTTPPTISIPNDVTIECGEDETSSNTGVATGIDSCGSVIISHSDTENAACGNSKTILRTWTATDACNNSVSEVQTITVTDTTNPVFNESLPTDVTVTFDTIPTPANLTASDNCDSNVDVVFTESENGSYCDATHTIIRHWIAEDDCGNSIEHTQTLTVNHPVISATVDAVSDVDCFGEASGSIFISVTGGTQPYTYLWSNSETTEDLNNVLAGSYSVTITDSNNCSTTVSATIDEPASTLNLSISKTDATTAQGCSNGEAIASASGGTAPYTFLWSASASNQTTATANNLPSGNHSVVVTDANGCETTQSIEILCDDTCDVVVTTESSNNVSCFGEATGSATVSASSNANPTATYTFTWSNGQVDSGVTTSTLNNLAAATYDVSVTIDGAVCSPTEKSVVISQPSSALSVTAIASDLLGPLTNDGIIVATATGGTPPYSYLWSPTGQTTSSIIGLAVGNYSVTVTDANGCIAVMSASVNSGSCNNLSVSGTSTPVSCNGESDGSVTAIVSNGTGPFTYEWDGLSDTTSTVNDLPAGNYTVIVTDQTTGCKQNTTINISEPAVLSTSTVITNALCKDDHNGAIDLTVSGGTAPYTFLWSNGEISEDLSDLIAGTYSVVVTDANGCKITTDSTINEPTNELSATISSQTDIVCIGLGQFTVEGTGGTAPYMYSIDNGVNYVSNGTFTNLNEGSYLIDILDANGCNFKITVDILSNCTDAIADINNTFVNQPVSGNVLTNDEDFEGDNQTVTANTNPTNGTVVVNPDGSYTYTPNPGFIGQDTFEYTICDDGNPQACDTATVYIEVLPEGGPENEAPIANADTATTPEGTPIDIVVLANDFDPDADPITITATTDPANGTVTLNPDGTITYTPDAGFIGEDTFTYTICDDGNPQLCDTATVTVTVQPSGYPNTTNANDDAYNTTPGADVIGNVLLNDNDIEGDIQTVTTTTVTTTNGVTVNIDPNTGVFTYTPITGFVGTDTFVYTICDNGSPVACDQATVYITVGGLANTTDAIADINNTFVNQPVSGNVLTNDEDFEGDNQTVTANTQPTNGTVVVNPDGSYTYTPNPGFIGQDTFEYTICDDGNPQACDTATVYIEVLPEGGPENEAPIANADTATTPEGTPIDIVVLANDFDPDADPITITATTDPANGTVTLNPDGTITYTPDAGFIGEDTFTYTICDDGNPQLCDTATVTVTVQPTGYPNTTNANDDAYNTTPGTDVIGNVLANDNDIEGDTQTVTTTTVTTTNGVTVNINPNTGVFTYTPNAGFSGTDSFVYDIRDNGSPIATDKATVYITVGGIANTTDAIADIDNTYVDQPVSGNVLTNDEDFEGDNQTVTANTQPANGTVVVNPDGSYTYTPNPGFIGQDTFEYTICDDGNPQACDTATVYIEVLPEGGPENEAPIANADTATTPEGTPIDIVVLANDFDPDADPITITATTDPANGTVTLNPDGTITYTPDAGFIGEDTFTYTICDDGNPQLCDTATVTVTVQPSGYPNTTNANDDAYNTTPGADVIGNVLLNDNDIEGDIQTVTTTTVTTTNGVTVNIDPNTGVFTYTPITGFVGTDTFVYTICDNGSPVACDQATVYITVGGLANTTDAIADINNTFVNQPVSGNVLTNDEDFEGDNQTVTANTQPTNGTVVVNPDGSYTYTPNPGFIGQDTFEYTICDDGNPQACDTATVYIEVLPEGGPENEAPIANADTATTPEGTPIDIVVLANDFDPDADPITITGTTDPANGTVTLNPDGTITYTPDAGFIGEDTFTYTICDNGNPQLCDTATVTVTVQPSGYPNTTNANDDAYTVTPTSILTGNVLLNDNDIEGDTQTVVTTTVITNEGVTVNINPNTGEFTYTPNAGYTGTDSFIYTICDNGSPQACDEATVYITIEGVAGLSIIKSASSTATGCVSAGDAVTYIFTVTNSGDILINSITITDDLLGGDITSTLSLSGDNGDNILDPSEIWIFTAPDYTITQADVDAGNITNNVTADGLEPDGTTTVQATDTYIIDANNPDVTLCDAGGIAIEKAASSATAGCVGEGDLVIYTFTVTNTGDVSINSITITDDLLGGDITSTLSLSGDNGDGLLDPTETWIFTAPDYTLTQADVDAGNITNNVTADGLEPDGTTTVQATDTYVIDANNPDVTLCSDSGIAISKAASSPTSGCVGEGDLVTYTFTVINNGQVSINTITITDDILGGDITTSLTLTGDTNNDGLLDPTETWIFTAPDYTITQADVDAGNITNNVTADGLEPDGTTTVQATDTYIIDANNPDVTLCDAGGIAIVKAASSATAGCVGEGDLITYTFTVTNTGDVSINSITITDDLLGGDITSTLTLTGDNGDGILDPTETWIFTAPEYTITQADVDAGNITNNVTADGLEPDGTTTVQATDTYVIDANNPDVTLCDAGGIAVVKAASSPNAGCVGEGDLVTYTFTVTNTGDVSINSITITDDLLGGDITSTLTLTGDNGDGILDPTETWIFTAPDYTITQADVDAGNITNNVTADGLEPDGTTTVQATDTYVIDANNPDVTLCSDSGIAISKAASSPITGCVGEGDLVTYTFTVVNNGQVSINTITITDDLLGGDITTSLTLTGDTNNDGLLDPTETWVFTAPDYTITQADVDAGNITNNVTADGLEPDGTTAVQATDTYVIDANNPDVTLCDAGGIAIVKAASSPTAGCVGEGDLVAYTFTVTNTGDVSINSITITDDLLGGDITSTLSLSGDNGDNILDPSETWIFTAPDYTITQADVDAGNITNNVTADGLEPDGTTTVQATDTYVIDANNPDVTLCSDSGISLLKSGVFNNDNGNECTEIDETITYTFTVSNNGDIALGNVIIADPLLENATPAVSINFVTGDTDGDNQLDPTETWVYNATYLVTQTDIDATEVTNTATVTATEVVNGTTVTATSQTTTDLIEDITPPDVTNCAVLDETIECSGSDNETMAANWNASNILALENCATDACDNNFTITSNYDFNNLVSTCGASGTINVIYTLTDATGNASTFNATLTLEDTTGPDLSACAVADETIECNGSDNETLATAWNTANIATLETCGTDTCDLIPTNVVTSNYNFTNLVPTCGSGGSITVIYTVADDCGNTSTLSATLTIEDTTPPTFSVPADITVECDVDITDLSLTGDVSDESDDCSSLALDATYTDSVVEGSCPNESIITRTWSLTDECNNTTNFVQTITVQDATAPTFNESLPADTNAECDNVPTVETLTASDNCGSANVVFNEEITNGSCVGDYIIVRTWTATDSCNNETVHTQIITVEDNTAPTLVTAYDDNVTVACDAIPEVPSLVFEDSCSNNMDVQFNEESTQINDFEDYSIIRTWTVSDDCGNEAIFTQNVTVEISNVINVMDAERCVLDIEFDLFDLLSGDFNMDGIWSVVAGNTTLDGSYFDPSTAEVGVYTFMYSITEGPCPREVEVNVAIDDDCLVLPCSSEDNILISKTVTANGDDVNDFFTVESIEQCGFVIELQIFNRWGAEIYKSNNYQNDWNGNAHGSSVGSSGKVPTGTYYYIINVKNSGLAPFTGPIYVSTN